MVVVIQLVWWGRLYNSIRLHGVEFVIMLSKRGLKSVCDCRRSLLSYLKGWTLDLSCGGGVITCDSFSSSTSIVAASSFSPSMLSPSE